MNNLAASSVVDFCPAHRGDESISIRIVDDRPFSQHILRIVFNLLLYSYFIPILLEISFVLTRLIGLYMNYRVSYVILLTIAVNEGGLRSSG